MVTEVLAAIKDDCQIEVSAVLLIDLQNALLAKVIFVTSTSHTSSYL